MPQYPLLATGQQAVTTSAVALPSVSAGAGDGIEVILSALKANAASVFYGPAGVTDATGAELPPGASVKFRISNLDLIFVIAAATGNSVSWAVTNI